MQTDDIERSGTGEQRDPDLSRAVLEDLYRYPRKHPLLAWGLWLFTGLLGGHRFYLEKTATGVAMLFTGGGLVVWWIIDAFRVSAMVQAHNDEQLRRQTAGLPPLALDFMPSLDRDVLDGRPEWATRRSGRSRLISDAVVLTFAGFVLGSITASSGNVEGAIAVLVLIAVTNLGARWEELARRPVLRSLDRWSHRLRIYYWVNDPGSPLKLLFRPLLGPITAFFRKRARTEVRLYLQLGAGFVIAFTLLDVGQALFAAGVDGSDLAQAVARDMVWTFVVIYAFATPIGATLTAHVLLDRSDRTLWALSALTVGALLLGWTGG